jgi:hypothetical protein
VIISDSERESLIDAAFDQMTAASDEAVQRQHWRDMIYHVRLRSAEQVLKMETERRISAKYAPLVTYQMGDVYITPELWKHTGECNSNNSLRCGRGELPECICGAK